MDSAQVWSIVAVVLGSGSAVGLVVVEMIRKFGRGPEVKQTEVQFGVGILEKQIERAAAESARWLEVERFLRDELRKSESDKDRIEELLATANLQILALRKERDELLGRQQLLVVKFRRGDQITLADITGQPDLDREIDDLEDTLTI